MEREDLDSDGDDEGLGGMFAVDEDDYVDVDVARAAAAPAVAGAPAGAAGLEEASSERLRVSDYGAEKFWHTRWDPDADAGYEWYTVSAAELWPVLQPLAHELRLLDPVPDSDGAARQRVAELGCGLSRLCLDLALNHEMQGLLATDVVPQAVEVLRATAAKEGLSPPTVDFAVENALCTSYADRSFKLVLDKGCADMFALNNDAGQLVTYAAEAARLTADGGYCVVVTAWDLERRVERCKLFAPLRLVSTTLVHQHGPAQTNVMVMQRPAIVQQKGLA